MATCQVPPQDRVPVVMLGTIRALRLPRALRVWEVSIKDLTFETRASRVRRASTPTRTRELVAHNALLVKS